MDSSQEIAGDSLVARTPPPSTRAVASVESRPTGRPGKGAGAQDLMKLRKAGGPVLGGGGRGGGNATEEAWFEAYVEDDENMCWLCGDGFSAQKPSQTWKNLHVHGGCKSALRAHHTLVKTPTAKTAAARLRRENLSEFKAKVMGLHPPESGYRDRDLASGYAASFESYFDTNLTEGELLVNKERFIMFHKQVDGWGSETGSEQFDKELDDQSSQSDDGNGQPQVWVQKPLERKKVRGMRTAGTWLNGSAGSGSVLDGRKRRSSHDPDSSSRIGDRNSSSGRCRRWRAGSIHDQADDDQAGTEDGEGLEEQPDSNLSSRGSGSGRESKRRRAARTPSPSASRRRRGGSDSGRQSSLISALAPKSPSNASSAAQTPSVANRLTKKGQPAKGGSVIDLVEGDSQQQASATAFLAQKDKLKKAVEEESRKMSLKTFVGKTLAAQVRKLSSEQLAELRKLGDVDQLQKSFEALEKGFKDLVKALTDVVQETIKQWEDKLAAAQSELADATKRAGS